MRVSEMVKLAIERDGTGDKWHRGIPAGHYGAAVRDNETMRLYSWLSKNCAVTPSRRVHAKLIEDEQR